MKNCLIIILSIISYINLSAQEVTLIDSEGKPIAYIDYDYEATIFLWNGYPVAFLENDRDDTCIFGFDGNFLGWYDKGIVYDKNGKVVGSRKGALNVLGQIEPIKSIQQFAPFRPLTPLTPMQPILSNTWSSTSLIEFLSLGKL